MRRERPRRRFRGWLPVVVVLSMLLVGQWSSVFGQVVSATEDPNRRVEPAPLGSDLVFLGGNAVLGGFAAGLTRSLRGGSFWDAFRDGALGGAVSYAGRRVAVEGFGGAGLVGREVAAMGSSFVHNASEGNSLLDEVVLPLGIARLYVRNDTTPGRSFRVRLKLDVPTALATVYFGVRRDADFDLAASLSAGTPVFYTRDPSADEGWFGAQTAGTIWLEGNPSDPSPETHEAEVFRHERVHVVQYDFTALGWGHSFDRFLTNRIPGGSWVEGHFDLGAHVAAWGLANLLIPYGQRPWEHEAHFLSSVSSHRK